MQGDDRWTYRFEAGRIYRMPTHFGPAPRNLANRRATFLFDPTRRSTTVFPSRRAFLTDPVVLEQHLPEGFILAGEPVVTVEFHHMTDIDWARRTWLHDDLGRLAGNVHRQSGPSHRQVSGRRLGESRRSDHHRTVTRIGHPKLYAEIAEPRPVERGPDLHGGLDGIPLSSSSRFRSCRTQVWTGKALPRTEP